MLLIFAQANSSPASTCKVLLGSSHLFPMERALDTAHFGGD